MSAASSRTASPPLTAKDKQPLASHSAEKTPEHSNTRASLNKQTVDSTASNSNQASLRLDEAASSQRSAPGAASEQPVNSAQQPSADDTPADDLSLEPNHQEPEASVASKQVRSFLVAEFHMESMFTLFLPI